MDGCCRAQIKKGVNSKYEQKSLQKGETHSYKQTFHRLSHSFEIMSIVSTWVPESVRGYKEIPVYLPHSLFFFNGMSVSERRISPVLYFLDIVGSHCILNSSAHTIETLPPVYFQIDPKEPVWTAKLFLNHRSHACRLVNENNGFSSRTRIRYCRSTDLLTVDPLVTVPTKSEND